MKLHNNFTNYYLYPCLPIVLDIFLHLVRCLEKYDFCRSVFLLSSLTNCFYNLSCIKLFFMVKFAPDFPCDICSLYTCTFY